MSIHSLHTQNNSIPVKRDNRIDTIRGLLLLSMAIDHYGGWIFKYTWEPFGFISDAEGFIFMSGFVFAMVYGRYVFNYNLLAIKIIKRFFNIYCYHIAMVLGLPLLMIIFPLAQKYWGNLFSYFYISPVKYFFASMLLVNDPPLMDILPVYVVVILFSWPILIFLSRGWNFLTLSISVSVWVLGQYYDPVYLAERFFQGAPPVSFNIFSWQLVFFLGVYFGFRKYRDLPNLIPYKKITIISAFTIFIVLFLIKYHIIPVDTEFMSSLTIRYNLGWLRVINFLSIAYLVSVLLKKIPISAKIPWVHFLGKHSLQVFSFHIVIAYFFLIPWGSGRGIYDKHGNGIYLLVMFLFLISLSIPAYAHKMFMKNKADKKVKTVS